MASTVNPQTSASPRWQHLQATSWPDIDSLADMSRDWVFRGAPWDKEAHPQVPYLRSGIERLAPDRGVNRANLVPMEQRAVAEFRRRADQYGVPRGVGESPFESLALLQHHGMPTRMIDFTRSIYVALFFALRRAKIGKWALLWGINARRLRQNAVAILDPKWNGDDVEKFRAADVLDEILAGKLSAPPTAAIDMEPFRMNERLTAQQGLFVVPVNIVETAHRNLAATLGIDNHPDAGPSADAESMGHLNQDALMITVEVPLKAALAEDLRSDLERMNINAATLFPGIDGFAESLTKYIDRSVRPSAIWTTPRGAR